MRKKTRQIVVVAFAAALAGFLLAAGFWSLNRPQRPAAQQQQQAAQPQGTQQQQGQQPAGQNAQQAAAQQQPQDDGGMLGALGINQPSVNDPMQEASAESDWRVRVPRMIL
ncbi:MAG TPA: hypothetical protein VK421_10690, partial [Pyrinomonadaceae bacterium]|nr:hypothetical protein [Pyrinomonadaceae bacterium]